MNTDKKISAIKVGAFGLGAVTIGMIPFRLSYFLFQEYGFGGGLFDSSSASVYFDWIVTLTYLLLWCLGTSGAILVFAWFAFRSAAPKSPKSEEEPSV